MDFSELYNKIRLIDEGQECGMGECGVMGPPIISKENSQQPDSVSMSVNMNASGAGGIKDLIDILKNIEQSVDTDDSDIKLFGRTNPDSKTIVIGDEYANSDESHTFPMTSVTNPPSNDLHKAANSGYSRVAATTSGSNPMAESLISRLSNLYFEIKNK